MSGKSRGVALGIAFAAGVGAVWLWTGDQERAQGPAGAARSAPPRPGAGSPAVAPDAGGGGRTLAALEPAPRDEAEGDAAPSGESGHAHAPDPGLADELAWYRQHPMSEVPHLVVRGWGARPDAPRPGVVGAYVVVDPALPTAELERLARDIHSYHEDADALTVRIVDSEEAATYDWHVDAREFLHRHLVASVRRNRSLEVDSIEIRGIEIEP